MSEPRTGTTARERRDEIRTKATEMVTHLRTEVLSVAGRRAAVRAALGHAPGEPRTFRAYREVAEFFPAKSSRSTERAFLAVGAMICAQPASNRKQDITAASVGDDASETAADGELADEQKKSHPSSLGASCAEAAGRGAVAEKALETRLHQLCRTDAAGVHRQLPRLVHHLRGIGITIDWAALVDDLASWDHARQHIAARWLREFYRGLTANSASPTPDTTETTQENQS